MNSFTYARAIDVADAVRQGGEANAKYLGGGTNLVDLMRETLERPSSLVDVTGLSSAITEREDGSILIGAAAKNTAVAEHIAVRTRYPLVARAISGPRLGTDTKHGDRWGKPVAAHQVHLLLSSFEKEEDIYRAIRAGAHGYLLKDTTESEMVAAISVVNAGKRYIPRHIAARLADRMMRSDLTARELQILELVAQGSTNKQIAAALDISDNTVRHHVNNIMEKLQVSDRTEAVATALRQGVLSGTD